MSKREPGPDLIRCLAFFFVVLFHSFLNNGYYYEPQAGAAMWVWGSVRWLSTANNGLFLMLTGYLQSGKSSYKACRHGLASVLLGYALASSASIPIRQFALGEAETLWTWVQRFLSFRGVYYGWYVGMYVGLALLMPFLNRGLSQIHTIQSFCFLLAVLIAITALPGALPFPVGSNYWRSLYPITYYCLGAFVKRRKPATPPWIGLSLACLLALGLGAATVISTDGALNEAFSQEFGDLWIVCICLCLFLSLYRLRLSPHAARLAAFLSGGCYGAYLLSHLLDAWVYRLFPQWHTPSKYWILLLAVTLPIFICTLMVGKLLSTVTGQILRTRRMRHANSQ